MRTRPGTHRFEFPGTVTEAGKPRNYGRGGLCRRLPAVLDPVPARRETVAVLRAGAVVFFGAWLWIGLHAAPGAALAGKSDLLPFQRLFGDLDPGVQRSYRVLLEGIAEAERVRAESGTWPAVADLAAEGVPPFAPDPVDKSRYGWTLVHEGTVVNYRGRPAVPASPDLLLVVQEPEKGAIDPSMPSGVADETHHLLSDGTLLHVTVWFRRAGATDVGSIVDRPFAEGWTQILAGIPAPRSGS